jgi:conjugal transfer pilus assembly protein TraV
VKALVVRFVTVALLLPLTACTALSGLGGESHYACKAPEGVACDSVSGTYTNALHNKLPSQRAPRSGPMPNERGDAGTPLSALHTASLAASPGLAPASESAASLAQPLRSQARVLRLWIKPWEDADGDLYDQGYVYVQVEGGRWMIDHVQRQIRDAYAPLKAPPKPASEAAVEPQPGGNLGGNLPAPATQLLLQRAAAPGAGASRSE